MISRGRTDRGFTLPEALIATAVLSVAVLSVTEAVVSGQMQAYDAQHAQRALMIGEQLIERVLSMQYDDPGGALTIGPDAGETNVNLFDNIDDFHGYSESAGNLVDAAGAALPSEFADFTRSVTVTSGSVNVPGFSAAVDGLTITVTVTDARGRMWTLTRFVAEPIVGTGNPDDELDIDWGDEDSDEPEVDDDQDSDHNHSGDKHGDQDKHLDHGNRNGNDDHDHNDHDKGGKHK